MAFLRELVFWILVGIKITCQEGVSRAGTLTQRLLPWIIRDID
jgi:hypothetical protein